MKKIIIINLIIILILFCALEFASYLYIRNDAYEFIKNYNEAAKKENKQLLTQRYARVYLFNQKEQSFRNTNISNSKKQPILFFGCSYLYGTGLEEQETLPYVIFKKTSRSTVNRGLPGGSIINTLYDLNDEDFYNYLDKKNIKNPQYIVYLYITDHLNRISNPYRSSVTNSKEYPHYEVHSIYKNKNGKLTEIKPSEIQLPFYGLYITKAWYYLYADKFAHNTKEQRMIELFNYAKSITDKKFPGSKFVIILYKDGGGFVLRDEYVKKLKNSGFIVLNAEDLAGHELNSEQWRISDKEHPSAKAIKDVAKGLIKELKL